jgi:hypothetical protein
MNIKLEQQVTFFENLCRLREFASVNGFCLIFDIPHLDVGCEYGRAMYSDSLSVAFKLFGRTPAGELSYFGLKEDHALLSKYWLSLDTRCKYEDRIYSMPWKGVNQP